MPKCFLFETKYDNIKNVFIIFHKRDEYLAKIQKRVDNYKIEELNAPRDGKKLLVLDIDYTLFGKLKS